MRQNNEPQPRPLSQRLLDAWFCPKRFESATLCERLGVLFLKRYVPTGVDLFIRRYGIRISFAAFLDRSTLTSLSVGVYTHLLAKPNPLRSAHTQCSM